MKTNFLELDPLFSEYYKKLSEVFVYADEHAISIDSICRKIFNIYPRMLSAAETEEDNAFVNACAKEIVDCYQRALERNYNEIKDHKQQGLMDSWAIESWTLTLDQNGTPTMTTVVDINKKGYPVYADNCIGVIVGYDLTEVGTCRHKLNRWLQSNRNLYELRLAAQKLKEKGSLGMSDPPAPNYNLDGLVGGQLDAAAWQNYAIENGLVHRTNYDEELDKLLTSIDKCIDFYEKAISMV